MSSREVSVWLDERWYNALSRQLKKKDTTVEEMLEEHLDEMLNQLPAPVYERISREIWEEDQRQREAAEAAQPISVFRVTQSGRTDHLLTQSAMRVDVLHAATALRTYLLAKGNSTQRFAERLHSVMDIAPEVFQDYADELMRRTGRVTAALDIDLDRGEFSTLDALNGWETYAIRDVSTAAWHATRKDHLEWERRLDIFAGHLETRMLRCDAPEAEPTNGPVM
ncbi:MAG: hypothetical protein K1W21_15015 [Oscillospiraceae bacterium]